LTLRAVLWSAPFMFSIGLAEKKRVGARDSKRYHAPETPCSRLIASSSVPEAMKERLRVVATALDPLRLLDAASAGMGASDGGGLSVGRARVLLAAWVLGPLASFAVVWAAYRLSSSPLKKRRPAPPSGRGFRSACRRHRRCGSAALSRSRERLRGIRVSLRRREQAQRRLSGSVGRR
jgi:hypothetical protein